MLGTRDEAKVVNTEIADKLLQIPLNLELSDQIMKVSSELTLVKSAKLQEALRHKADIFSWSAKNMPRVSPDVITHRLNMDPTYHPVKQKRRNFTLDHSWAIEEEVSKLFEAGFIREVQYPEWLANMVMVKKAMDK